MKWLFLMAEETRVRDEIPFYDFLPYQYGPFSFTVYQELARLEKMGLIADDLSIPKDVQRDVADAVSRLSQVVLDDADRILDRYGDMAHDELIDDVYARYDWFASRSKLRPPHERQPASPSVFTTGYEGESVDAFLNKLLAAGIERVLDVRKNAYSQKYGFSRAPLKTNCEKVDIEYRHLPELGIPSDMRTDLSTRELRKRLFVTYERELLPRQSDAKKRAAELLQERATVLLCVERHHEDCHRGTLAPHLARMTGLPIAHI